METWLKGTIDRLKVYFPQVDETRVLDAYELSKKAYGKRKVLCANGACEVAGKCGEGFVLNMADVVDLLIPFKPDEDTLVAALLYDVVDAGLEERFGEDVMKILDGLRILKNIKAEGYQSADKVDLLRKLFLVMAKDIRVLIIFLAVKVIQMQGLDKLSKDCQTAFSSEVSEIFVPIAGRLGIYRFKTILEDLSFKFLHEDEYKTVSAQMDKLGQKKKEYIDSACEALENFYGDNGFMGVRVSGRLKGVHSVYNKMKAKGFDAIDAIYDMFAVRIIVPAVYASDKEEDVSKLYAALGLLHSRWRPIASRFKDFIAVPKPNGYRSLHTTVMGLSYGDITYPVEVQIRSSAMHEEAEYGVASHWLYKDTGRKRGWGMLRSHVEWLQNLAILHSDLKDDEKVLENFKLDLFGDRIYVLTPKGDVKELPKGATPLDFAYVVHTDIGHKCVLSKVNGKPVSLDSVLDNGDTVEIVTRKDSAPKLEWLAIVKTSQAKVRIKNWFAAQDEGKNIRRGRDQLNAQLKRFGKPLLTPQLNVLKDFAGQHLDFQEREKILEEIGRGSQLASNAIRKIYTANELFAERVTVRAKKDKISVASVNIEDKVLFGGVSGLKVKIAKCCCPSVGDEIIGYVSVIASAATVHKKDCPKLKKLNPKRFIPASFNGEAMRVHKGISRVGIRVSAKNRVGLLRDIGSAVASNDVNIFSYSDPGISGEGMHLIIDMIVDVVELEQLEKVLDSIERVDGVETVTKAN